MQSNEFVKKAWEVVNNHKTVYMWGTFGAPVTEKLIAQKAAQYPSHYGSAKQKYLRERIGQGYFAFDCVGLIKGILWGWRGDASQSHGGCTYQANGVPDTNVGGMMKLCSGVSGDFTTIVPGELVATSDHIGIYLGNGKVAEATPLWKDGVQITACTNIGTISGFPSRKWDRHGKLKFIEYEGESALTAAAQYLKDKFGLLFGGLDFSIAGVESVIEDLAKANGYAETIQAEKSKYELKNGMHIIKIPVDKFRLQWWDKKKKTTAIADYFNCGYFASYSGEEGTPFTLPVANLKADIEPDEVTPEALKYLREWGKVEGGKVVIDCRKQGSNQFKGKSPSTLIVWADGKVSIDPVNAIPEEAVYAVAGAPVILDGADTSYSRDVLGEGWDSSIVRATWHGFLGLKGDGYIYYIGMKTTKSNLFSSSEAYKKLAPLGFRDVIKVDGGGSFVLDKDGKNVAVTSENRQVNNVGRY